ncbi:MAG: hypothetical protein ABI459_03430 [Deltaproteobacteria bacterium]
MLRALILLMSLGCALPVQSADVVTASPPIAYVQGVGAQLITVRWTITINTSIPQTVTLVSTGGTLTAGAQPPVNVGTALRRVVKLNVGTNVVRINERLRVDRTTARHILESGPGVFTRIFSDSLGSATGTLALQARSTGSGGLSLQNVDLHFDDASLYRVIGSGAALTALAKVTTTGRGRLEAIWQLQGPSGGFRTLRRVTLAAGGPRATSLESPPLPTDQPGQYRLKLVLGGDGAGSDDPVITYVVGSGGAVAALALKTPAADAKLSAATRFEWTPITGAARYRVEFMALGSSTVIAGVDVAASGATIKPFTLSRIDNGAVTWRVTAYDAAGAVLAQSPHRRIGGTFVQSKP